MRRHFQWLAAVLSLALLTSSLAVTAIAQTPDILAGDMVYYGGYATTKDGQSVRAELPWLVLEIKDGNALLLSRYLIRGMCYSYDDGVSAYSDRISTDWEYSTIRRWMNTGDEVVVSAKGVTALGFADYFTQAQWDAILTTAVDTGTKTLSDKVFLLSVEDAENPAYFANAEARLAGFLPGSYLSGGKPGSYSGSYDGGRFEWWLRTPDAERVRYVRSVSYASGDVTHNTVTKPIGVRPALWLPLSALAGPSAAEAGAPSGAASFTEASDGYDDAAYKALHASVGSGLVDGHTPGSGNCTWYALARALEILQETGQPALPLLLRPETERNTFQGNAGFWYGDNLFLNERGMGYAYSPDEPVAGSLAVWRVRSADGTLSENGRGHVAVVEKVVGNMVTLSEGNYGVIDQETGELRYNYPYQQVTMSKEALAARSGYGELQGYVYFLRPER